MLKTKFTTAELWLEFNSITGKIPDELYSLSSLLYLLIDINSLTGKVSPMIGQLKELQFVSDIASAEIAPHLSILLLLLLI
jgi:hypothetical protein